GVGKKEYHGSDYRKAPERSRRKGGTPLPQELQQIFEPRPEARRTSPPMRIPPPPERARRRRLPLAMLPGLISRADEYTSLFIWIMFVFLLTHPKICS